MKMGIITRISFWVTKGGYTWNNNKMKILNNKLLKLEDEIGRIRNFLFVEFTDFKEDKLEKRTNKHLDYWTNKKITKPRKIAFVRKIPERRKTTSRIIKR